jgi:hypothetical protein
MNWVSFRLHHLIYFSFRLPTSKVRRIFLFVTAFSIAVTPMIFLICFCIWHLLVQFHRVALFYRIVTQRILLNN